MPPHEPEPFRVDVSRHEDSARLRLTGELDLDTTPILEAEITALRETGSRSLVLDLSGLEFIDSSGLHCILECEAESRQDGFSIALIQGPPAIRRIFELTNTDTLLRFVET